MYEVGSTSRELINGLADTYFLVNIVRNDFRNPDRLAIFRIFEEAAHGMTNGKDHKSSHDRTISLTTATLVMILAYLRTSTDSLVFTGRV